MYVWWCCVQSLIREARLLQTSSSSSHFQPPSWPSHTLTSVVICRTGLVSFSFNQTDNDTNKQTNQIYFSFRPAMLAQSNVDIWRGRSNGSRVFFISTNWQWRKHTNRPTDFILNSLPPCWTNQTLTSNVLLLSESQSTEIARWPALSRLASPRSRPDGRLAWRRNSRGEVRAPHWARWSILLYCI